MSIPPSPRAALLRGAVWTVGTRWSIKGFGFANTVVMARLLAPDDYGLVALATLVVGALQALTDVGAATALLRKHELTQDEIDSAWTLRLLQYTATAALILAASPLAAMFFHEPRLRWLLWTFSGSTLLMGLANIGPTLALKQYQFQVDFKINVFSKIASVAVTLAFGWWLRDYRALLAGIVAGQMASLVLSYALHPYRPHWCTRQMASLWALTKWLMAANMGTFILRKGDEVVAGRLVGAHDYGLYNVGADLGSLPVQEIGPAMLRALLPVLASFKDDTARLNAAVVKALAGLNGGIWGISATFAVLAPDVTIVLLGPQWRGASIFVAWFAVVAAAQTACMPLRSYLTLLGETKSQSATVWSEFLVFCCVALAAVPAFGLLGLVMARLTGSVSAGAHLLYQAVRLGRIELRPALISLGRPVLAAILAYAVGFVLAAQLHELVLRMLLAALASAATYVAASTFSWRLAGRPEGIESIVIDLWSSFRGRQRLRWR